MKIAIFSDIHSNLEALQACCHRAEQEYVERYVCLGDITGYGADPSAVIELLLELPELIAVRGNHEAALLSNSYGRMRPSIQHAIQWTRQQLSPEHIDFLKGLPLIRNEYGVTFTHASTNTPLNWDYINTPEESKSCMDAADTNVTFIGHVHVPNVFYETPAGALKVSDAWEGLSIPLFRQCRYVVNVGSVGQPRDGIHAASFVIYDMDARTVTFHRVPYDYNTAARKILDASLDRSFADRLLAGT